MQKPKYIYHYFEKVNGPFLNLSSLSISEATTILKNTNEGFNSSRPDNYMELRLAHEKRLKEQFISIGGNPKRNDPFYFTLGPCDWLKSWYVNAGAVRLDLDLFIGSDALSFTYPDSMVSFQLYDNDKLKKYRKNCNGKIYLFDELDSLIKEFGIPTEENWNKIDENTHDRYIEVQIWNDEFLAHVNEDSFIN